VELSPRKKLILKAIVEDYIKYAEPVGSKTLAERWGLNFSSATIRNEMAELAEMGYLDQPHTSAGRVPSNLGYRFYVDALMNHHSLSAQEMDAISSALSIRLQELDRIIAEAGRALSRITNLPAYAATPISTDFSVRRYDLVFVDRHSFVVVAVTADDEVKSKLFRLPFEVDPSELQLLTIVLNTRFTGLSFDQIDSELIVSAEAESGSASRLLPLVLHFVAEMVLEGERRNLHLLGSGRILRHPEYRDTAKAQHLLDYLSDFSGLEQLPAPDRDHPVRIVVGDAKLQGPLRDTSMVVATYKVGRGMEGFIGVLGPTRIDYSKLTAGLTYFANTLTKLLSENPFDENEY